MSRITGQVVWFNNAKGFGFISSEGRPDIFVHFSAIEKEGYKSLKEGESVEFEIESGPGCKPQAGKVRRLEDAPHLSSMATAAPASVHVAA